MKEKALKELGPKAWEKTKRAYSASDAALRRSYRVWKARREIFTLRRRRNHKLRELGEEAFRLLCGGQLDSGELTGFKEAIAEIEAQIREKEAAIALELERPGPPEREEETSPPVAEPAMPGELEASQEASPEKPLEEKGEEPAA